MKKIICSTLALCGSLLLSQPAMAQCTWSQVGSVTTCTDVGSGGLVVRANSFNQIYILYSDQLNGGKATVATYNGSAWVVNGVLSTSYAGSLDMTFDNSGNPYVVFCDGANNNSPVVQKYNGSSWVQVGTGPVVGTSASNSVIKLSSTGMPYVAFSNSSSIATVMEYNGSAWVSVGTGTVSSGAAYSLKMVLDNTGLPCIAYSDANQSYLATVNKYTGSAWTTLGTAGLANTNSDFDLGMNSMGVPYLAYVDGTNSYKLTVMQYTAGAWSNVGAADFSTNGISTYPSPNVAILFDPNDVPYVAYKDNTSSGSVNVSRFYNSAWQNFTTVSLPMTLQSGVSITMDGAGDLVLASACNTSSPQAIPYVYRMLAPSFSAPPPGSDTECMYTPTTYSTNAMTYNGTNTVSYQWQYNTGSGYTNATNGSYYNGATSSALSLTSPTVSSLFRVIADDGCLSKVSSVTSLTVNPLPTVSVNTVAPHCAGTSVTFTASGASTYTWNTGANSASISVNPGTTTTYTVYGSSSTGCTSSVSTTDQVYAVPTSSFTSNSPVCPGDILTFTNLSSGATSYTWSGPGSYSSSVTNPTLSVTPLTMGGIYSLTAANANNCSSVYSASVTVLSSPSVAIAGPGSVCQGGTVTFTASGASSYLWSDASTTTSISVSPTVTTTYSVTGTAINGCTSTNSISLTVIPSKTLSGPVTSTIGAVSGSVILYKYRSILSKWDSVTTVPFTSSYSFGALDSAQYVVEAVPTATNVQITYGTSAISWQHATVISHGCTNNSTQSIVLQSYITLAAGSGEMAGTIGGGAGYHKTANIETPGNPIPGIVVKGGKNPGAAIFGETTTDASGHYAFTNVPNNAAGESYFILVDIPGLDTNHTYHEVLVTGNDIYTNLDFIVDSMYVNPVLSTSVNELTKADYLVNVFPNPTNGSFTLEYSLLKPAAVRAELVDVVGNTVRQIQPQVTQSPGSYKQSVPADDLRAGIYFVKLYLDQKTATIKLFITN